MPRYTTTPLPLIAGAAAAAAVAATGAYILYTRYTNKVSKMGLSAKTIEIVKATAPVMAEHGYAITSAMYGSMLTADPYIASLFNPSHQKVLPGDTHANQPRSLANAVYAYAANIDNLGALTSAVTRIAEKHVSLQIEASQYDVVGEHLMAAVKKVLGDAATEDVCAAWTEAYGFLASLFISTEKAIREARAAAPGGWEGWRNFVVKEKVKESDEIVSLHLTPQDGGPLPLFKPGQYTALRIEEGGLCTQRNYSLSSAPGLDHLRITVKRVPASKQGAPAGQVSEYIHDTVAAGHTLQVAVPCGDFFLDDAQLEDDLPLVLLSGGVGITPIVSMLEAAIAARCTKEIVVITCARSPKVEPMHALLEAHAKACTNVSFTALYTRLTMNHVRKAAADRGFDLKSAHTFFCGPKGFMKMVYSGLREMQVPENQVHFEFFGPHTDLV